MTTTKKDNTVIIDTVYNKKKLKLKFRRPSKLVYQLLLNHYASGELFEMAETIIKNCYVKGEDGIDLINELSLISALIPDLTSKVTDLKPVKILTTYKGTKHKDLYNKLLEDNDFVFVVTVDNTHTIFIKPLDRVDYRNVFNKTAKSILTGLNYVHQELMLGGDNIYDDPTLFMSCYNIAEYLITYKENSIKKK